MLLRREGFRFRQRRLFCSIWDCQSRVEFCKFRESNLLGMRRPWSLHRSRRYNFLQHRHIQQRLQTWQHIGLRLRQETGSKLVQHAPNFVGGSTGDLGMLQLPFRQGLQMQQHVFQQTRQRRQIAEPHRRRAASQCMCPSVG